MTPRTTTITSAPSLQWLVGPLLVLLTAVATGALAAPDEERLGKSQGYPVGTPANYALDELFRVGSFSQIDKINFSALSLAPLAPGQNVMPLRRASAEPKVLWRIDGRSYTVDDYLARQRVMGLLVIKDGEILVERYQYERKPEQRFISHSIAKSLTSLAVGFALAEGLLRSLDERADTLEPQLKGTLYGEATVRQLLRMSSGVRFSEVYDGKDDLTRFRAEAIAKGIAGGAALFKEREAEPGSRFHYASIETALLSQILYRVTGQDLAAFLSTRLWQPMGAAGEAAWLKDKRRGVVNGGGGFNATLADYGRLGVLLANDGARPDTGQQILPKAYLLEATDWKKHPNAFAPTKATPYFGYGYQFWLYPGEKRRFALLGVYGQTIFVDPALKLVMVQTSANATARSNQTSLGRESDALWRGLVAHYGAWD